MNRLAVEGTPRLEQEADGASVSREQPAPEPLAWGAMDLSLGRLYVAVNGRGALVRLTYGISEDEFLMELEESAGRRRPGSCPRNPACNARRLSARVAPILKQLDEYFAGKRREFEIEVDLSGLTPFQRRVLEVTRTIPYGETRSYGEVAAAAGKPKAARAVGQALGRNPVGIVIPCHRVVASDGSLHGFTASGGLKAKRFLLELEGAVGAEVMSREAKRRSTAGVI